MLVNDSDFSESDDDLEMLKAIIMDEELLDSHERLFLHYFAKSLVYPPELFRRRFQMKRSFFLRIQAAIEAHDPYFLQKRNCAGKLGLSSLQKITVALRMLAYGVAANFMDEYVRIGESISIESLKYFVKAIVDIFSNEYLRSPNSNDIAELLAVGESRGFPWMLGSIDCMHWKWKGMYTGHIHERIIILEAVASYDLWIWHVFFGLPASRNDINMLERSFVFSKLAQGRALAVNYTLNGNEYTMGYYLANAQEATIKDIERAFGVLQARFAIVRRSTCFWNTKMLKYIMKACIILPNMISEDEPDDNGVKDFNYDQIDDSPHVTVSQERTIELMEFIQCHRNIKDRQTDSHLQLNLVEHLWQLHNKS
ncbi:uncharacterized protein LOC114257248 [Camellia sinensis]|uniref:uncharacterized protein LOC114257248 n=1 Tax=Camellia sinensis TaxID=4442 RepID=UPI0010355F7C|nr:uncharacterized protein LOC114257248 [Camellia sinensis]